MGLLDLIPSSKTCIAVGIYAIIVFISMMCGKYLPDAGFWTISVLAGVLAVVSVPAWWYSSKLEAVNGMVDQTMQMAYDVTGVAMPMQ